MRANYINATKLPKKNQCQLLYVFKSKTKINKVTKNIPWQTIGTVFRSPLKTNEMVYARNKTLGNGILCYTRGSGYSDGISIEYWSFNSINFKKFNQIESNSETLDTYIFSKTFKSWESITTEILQIFHWCWEMLEFGCRNPSLLVDSSLHLYTDYKWTCSSNNNTILSWESVKDISIYIITG